MKFASKHNKDHIIEILGKDPFDHEMYICVHPQGWRFKLTEEQLNESYDLVTIRKKQNYIELLSTTGEKP